MHETGHKLCHSVICRCSSLENTYRLAPQQAFPVAKASAIIADVLEEHLEGYTYSYESCGKLSRSLANEIKDRTKLLLLTPTQHWQRYKLVCFVAMGDRKLASVSLASRCVWNEKCDTRAEATYSGKSLYALGVLYALYHE